MSWGGFAGKILYVDLTKKEVRTEPLSMDLAEKFIGGFGLTVKLAYDRITPGVEPLAPANPAVIGAGPLVGTNLPSSSRVYAVAKLPSNGTVSWCGAGGVTFGYLFKNAGYDLLVIEGRADRPVYLQIFDDQVEIKDAGSLWGLSVEETSETLWREIGRPLGVVAIGPAGENLSSMSMAFVDRIATMGRGGFGAVLGSKNLKAIAVRGTKGIEVADRKAYRQLSGQLFKSIREYPYLEEWQRLGLLKSFSQFPVEIYEKIKQRRVACVSCPVGCKDVVQIKDGEFAGLTAYSSSAVNLFTPMMYGFKDYRQAIKLVHDLDGYGLDMFEFFGVMKFAGALGGKGVIPRSEIEPEIVIDSLDSMTAWAKKTAYREGLGRILADGFKGLLAEFGPEAQDAAPSLVKGLHPYVGPDSAVAWNLFGTQELGQVMDPRGPHVGAGGSPTYFARRPLEVFPKHLTRMGVPQEALARILPGLGQGQAPRDLKIGRLLKYSHAWFATLGSMGICARAQINRFYNAELAAALYQAVTGIPTDLPGLRRKVDRVWTLYKMANLREGFDRKIDHLPDQWFQAGGFKNYVTDQPLSRDEAEAMINDYYDEWGWDPETGVPSDRQLKNLDLTDL